ncbi:4'-phosphopantetheinyl transferase family protein [Pontibacter arcticus]|uniref:4-phosphopantetheinyl transferase n=1 Tax=Pontibacter arcticus TaxID=2080288 RepID=A0A364RHA4_9BACT|nr:4'-phosphopantetheinyl transferase superfamily protein [Pontibacter arcticus]RAU83681.1 4-phosphopantetheinyl transferase [Pontibacter arcticus]
MPLLLTRKINDHTLLGIWQLSETETELRAALPAFVDISYLNEHVHQRRVCEWLASRVLLYTLLAEFTDEQLPVLRAETGQPYFKNANFHVSITHSPELAAVILSSKAQVGIDIELITPKALRVADKFLTEKEKVYTLASEKETCLYWSAKETLYKMYTRKKLIFKDNILLCPSSESNILQGCVQTDNFYKLYQIYHETLLGHILTYTSDNDVQPV